VTDATGEATERPDCSGSDGIRGTAVSGHSELRPVSLRVAPKNRIERGLVLSPTSAGKVESAAPEKKIVDLQTELKPTRREQSCRVRWRLKSRSTTSR
jgi:hypothetical protein